MSSESILTRARGRVVLSPGWRRWRRWLGRGGFYLLAAILAVPFVVPVIWMFTSALKPAAEIFAFPPELWPDTPQWGNFVEAFRIRPLARQYVNSTYIALVVTAGTLFVSSLAGYAFARIRFRGRNVLFVLLLSALLVPAEVTIIPLFRMMRAAGLVDTHWPLIIVPVFGAQAILGTFLMRQFFLSLPVELEEAGRVDGLGRFGLFWHVALPLARPPLAALGVLAFLNSWNQFLEPLVYLSSQERFTLPVALTTYTDGYGEPIWNVQLAAATLTIVPVVLAFIIAQRHFIRGITGTGIKG